jgi:hypothetical protein
MEKKTQTDDVVASPLRCAPRGDSVLMRADLMADVLGDAPTVSYPYGFVVIDALDFDVICYRVREGGMRDDWRTDLLLRLQHAEMETATLLAQAGAGQ